MNPRPDEGAPGTWDELVPFVVQCCQSAEPSHRESGLSIIGSVSEVEDGLGLLANSGVTDLNPILLEVEDDPGCSRRTREFLAARARG